MIVDPPLSPPPLSTPAGAERGANSHIWPRLLKQDVQRHGQRADWGSTNAGALAAANSAQAPNSSKPAPHDVQPNGHRGPWRPVLAGALTTTHNAQAPIAPKTTLRHHRSQVKGACTSSQKTHAQMRLLSPPFRPGGGGKGLGDRGGSTIKNTNTTLKNTTNNIATNQLLTRARGNLCL